MPIISAGIQGRKKKNKPTNKKPSQPTKKHKITPPKAPTTTQPAKKILVHPSSLPWIEWKFSWENLDSNWLQLSIVFSIFFIRKSAFQSFPFGCCMRHLSFCCFVSRCTRELWRISVFGLKSFLPFLVPCSDRSQKRNQSQFFVLPFITPDVCGALREFWGYNSIDFTDSPAN